MMNIPPEPATLDGSHVRLEPLTTGDYDRLSSIAFDDDLWKWTPTQVRTPEDLRNYIATALRMRDEGSSLPFVTVAKDGGEAAGSTRFASIDRANHRMEIGWTWIARPWQRTAVNTEAKYLMLRYAFETLGCIRVELKTDVLNTRSRAAMLRMGATEEGVLRRHVITASGRVRDTIYYSVLDDEWPVVRERLEAKLAVG